MNLFLYSSLQFPSSERVLIGFSCCQEEDIYRFVAQRHYDSIHSFIQEFSENKEKRLLSAN